MGPCVPPSNCGAMSRRWNSGRPQPQSLLTSASPSSKGTTTTGWATPLMAQVLTQRLSLRWQEGNPTGRGSLGRAMGPLLSLWPWPNWIPLPRTLSLLLCRMRTTVSARLHATWLKGGPDEVLHGKCFANSREFSGKCF